MGDQVETPPNTQAPTAVTPPATPVVPPVAVATGAPPPAPKKPVKPGEGGKPQPFDKHPGFMKRVKQEGRREALRFLKEELGVEDLEEAKAIYARGRAAADAGGTPAAGTPAAPAAGPDLEKARLARLNTKLKDRVERQKQKVIAVKSRGRDQRVELELRMDALRAGIADGHADFALDQYRKHVKAAPTREAILEAVPFFQAMRATAPYLFVSGTPPVTLSPTTSPPTSAQPGEVVPPAVGAGTAPPPVDAMKMSDEEFRKHSSRYNFRAGA